MAPTKREINKLEILKDNLIINYNNNTECNFPKIRIIGKLNNLLEINHLKKNTKKTESQENRKNIENISQILNQLVIMRKKLLVLSHLI